MMVQKTIIFINQCTKMFLKKSEQNILAWREFRNSLKIWPDDIDRVAKEWAKAPLVNHYLEYDDPKKWPDAWTLLSEGIFCDISIALGMFYTLYYSNYSHNETMEIRQYRLVDQHRNLNLVLLEHGKYMLNYSLGTIVNIQDVTSLPLPSHVVTAHNLPIRI